MEASDNSDVRMDLDNEPQPDALLMIALERGGQTRFSEDGYIEGAPELVVEVAQSRASYDLHAKWHAYRRNGVREYIVWFVLREGQYEPSSQTRTAFSEARALAGLWLDPAALVRVEIATVLDRVQQGLASPEHVAFIARLTPEPRPPEKLTRIAKDIFPILRHGNLTLG